MTCAAPARYASRAIARAISACSTRQLTMTSCPSWTFEPTRTASSAYRRSRSSGVRCSVAPVEVARAAGPERLVEGGAFRVLDRLLAGPREPLGARVEIGCGLAVERLLDARLLLALEERVVLERVLVQVRIERHLVIEAGVPSLEVEVVADRVCEQRVRLHDGVFEVRHDAF